MAKTESVPLITIPKLVGKYKQVRVTLFGASFFKGASSRLADDGFGLFILDQVFIHQSILSKLKGFLKKSHHCRKCDADLMGLKAHRRRFALQIEYKHLPTFKLEIEMPAMQCRKCGTGNAVNEENTKYIISAAIALAFESLKNRG